jgi:hypothetical protein
LGSVMFGFGEAVTLPCVCGMSVVFSGIVPLGTFTLLN